MVHVQVLTSSKSSGIAGGLTYETPNDLQPGAAVRMPLRNQIVEGIVVKVLADRHAPNFDVKSITESIGTRPFLTPYQIATLQWMANEYCCSLRQALQVWLPKPSWQTLLPQSVIQYRLSAPDVSVRGSRQQAVVDELLSGQWTSQTDIQSATSVPLATLRTLTQRDILERREVSEHDTVIPQLNLVRPKLHSDQLSAYQTLSTGNQPSLLFGVTGSGKTEVYAQLVADCIEAGKQAIVLVPEILLTEHCIDRYIELVGDRDAIAIWHSRMSDKKKRSLWRAIHAGTIRLVIGSRSALFTPVQELGLVVIDEEHEWTYKNEQTPRYNTRDVAQKLCHEASAKLVLGSATPSLEAWYRAQTNQYQLVELPKRYQNQPMPRVRIVDLAQVNFGSLYPFSPPLLQAIRDRLDVREQSVLFLNRRGSASALLCLDCRRRVISPDSKLPFTVHTNRSGSPYLIDHTTGVQVPVPQSCPGCSSTRLHMVGAGTQKIERIVEQQFPTARIIRADSDTLKHPEQMRLILETMRSNKADILLGTQAVVKGLDLPNVTLAAVLLADVGLSLPHFRAGERVFQLLTQLTGRSGRVKDGEVIIQTYRPDAPEVAFAARHETRAYLEQEYALREHAQYPPFIRMTRLLTRGSNPATQAKQLVAALTRCLQHGETVTSAPTLFSGGAQWQVLLKSDRPHDILSQVDTSGTSIDVDPVECV